MKRPSGVFAGVRHGSGCHAARRPAQQPSNRPLRGQRRRERMALAPRTVQNMLDLFRPEPMTALQSASCCRSPRTGVGRGTWDSACALRRGGNIWPSRRSSALHGQIENPAAEFRKLRRLRRRPDAASTPECGTVLPYSVLSPSARRSPTELQSPSSVSPFLPHALDAQKTRMPVARCAPRAAVTTPKLAPKGTAK